MPAHDPAAAEARAQEYLRRGSAGIPMVTGTKLGRALPVLDERRELESWVVPLLRGELLTGFVQLGKDLAFRRSSQFSPPADSADWLEEERIRERAQGVIGSSALVPAPYLSFDGSPDRIAWRVDVRLPGGSTQVIFVAGAFAYARNDLQAPPLD